MIQLIVQGQELDLFKDEVFAISKSISKVGKFDLRFGDVSIAFTVPSTSKNNRIFRYLSNLNNDNLGAFRRFDGEIREDDAVLSRGFYQILSTNNTKKTFKIRFFGGNSDWFDLIKNRFINEEYQKEGNNPNSNTYSLQYLNHNYEEDVIINSRINTDGYFYFIHDNGDNSNRNNNVVTEEDFQVGVYEHTIFKNIFDSIGIKTKGTLFNDALFYQPIITAGKDLSTFDKQNLNKLFRPTEDVLIDKNNFQLIQFPLNDNDPQWDGGTFTAQYDIDDFNVEFLLQGFHAPLTGNEIDLKIEWTQNGIPQPDINTVLNVGLTKTEGGLVYVSLQEYQNNFPLLKIGDTIKFFIKENNPGADDYFVTNSINFPNLGLSESYLYYELTGAIIPYNINNALPKIKQSDFIKEIMFRYGVISQYDAKKRVLTFDKFQNVDDNKTSAIDWSSKIDVSKDIDIDFTKIVQNYFKTSFIRYQEDTNDNQLRLFKTVAKNGLGDGVINIDNDNLTDEGDIYTSIYSGTKDAFTFPLQSSNFNLYLPYIPTFNASGEEQDLKPRVLIAVPDSKIESISNNYSEVVLNGNSYQNVGYAFFAKQQVTFFGIQSPELDTNLFTLSYQNYNSGGQNYIGLTLLNRNYDLYRRILNNPVYVPIYFNLKNTDVQNVDFLKPIWLDFSLDTGYYYLEEISQYKGDGSTTKCNLIKI